MTREHEHLEIDRNARMRRMRLIKSRDPLAYNDYPPELRDVDASSLESFMYPGVMVLEPAIFDLIPKLPPWPLFPGLLGPMVADGRPVFSYVHRGFFRTVDDLKAYQSLREEFEISPPHFEHLVFPSPT